MKFIFSVNNNWVLFIEICQIPIGYPVQRKITFLDLNVKMYVNLCVKAANQL